MKKRLFILTIILITIAVILLIVPFIGQNDDSWQSILRGGVIRVGMDAAYPPFESLDPITGDIIGFDADLAAALGEELGVRIELVNIAYDGLYDALLVGQVDMLISGLVDAPEYYGKATFSRPYFNAGEVILTRTDLPLTDVADLANKNVGVEYGSGGDVEARQWERRLEGLTITRFNSTSEAVDALLRSEVDGVISDGISAHLATGSQPMLQLGPYLTERNFAIAYQREADAMRIHVGKALDALIERGLIDLLIAKWFS